MMDGYPMLLAFDRAAAGSGNEDMLSSPVPEATWWDLEDVAVEDQTTAFTSARVGILRGGVFYPLWEKRSGSAANLYFMDAPLYLNVGDRLMARFTGATAGDKLTLTANGLERALGDAYMQEVPRGS